MFRGLPLRRVQDILRSASESALRSKLFADIAVDDDLEAWLEDHSYIGGFTATQRDAELFDQSAGWTQLLPRLFWNLQ